MVDVYPPKAGSIFDVRYSMFDVRCSTVRHPVEMLDAGRQKGFTAELRRRLIIDYLPKNGDLGKIFKKIQNFLKKL
jgi:hypothetical protein